MADIRVPIKCDCGCGKQLGHISCPPEEKGKWQKRTFGYMHATCAVKAKKEAAKKAREEKRLFEEAKKAVVEGTATEIQRRFFYDRIRLN